MFQVGGACKGHQLCLVEASVPKASCIQGEKCLSLSMQHPYCCLAEDSCIRNRKYKKYLIKWPLEEERDHVLKWERKETTSGSKMFSL